MDRMEAHSFTGAIPETYREPKPWKLQIYDALVEWVVGAVANGPTGADDATIAGLLETITWGGSRLKRRIMVIRLMANLGLLSSLTVALKTARGSRMPGLQKRFAGALVLARSWGLGRLGTCLVGRTSACSSTYPTKAGERLDNGGRPSVKASIVAVLSEGNTHMLELEDWIFCSVKSVSCGSRCRPIDYQALSGAGAVRPSPPQTGAVPRDTSYSSPLSSSLSRSCVCGRLRLWFRPQARSWFCY